METFQPRFGQPPPPVPPKESMFSAYVSNLNEFLDEFKCSSPLFPRFKSGAICVSTNTTFWDAIRILIYNKLLSAPVLDVNTNKVVGTFSMRAVLNLAVATFSEEQVAKLKETNFEQALREQTTLASKKLGELKDLGKLDPAYVVSSNEPLRRAMEIMVQTKTHRVIVVDDNDVPLTVITQSRLVSLFGTMMDTISSADKTLQELRLGFKKVFSVPQNITALTAFRFMKDQDVDGVAVVDRESGRLLGNLSTDDLKLLGYSFSYWSLLSLPVNEYLQKLAEIATSLNLRTHFKSPNEVIFVRPTDTFSSTMTKLYMHRIHRIFIVDEKQVPIGVVALHDILQHLWDLLFSEAAM